MKAKNMKSDDDEAQSSNLDMENQGTLTPKEMLDDVLKSLEEYTNEKAKDLLNNKPKLLSTLKTHRPIKLGEYHFGLSETLKKDRRLIVFEWKNKEMVQEYTRRSDRICLWLCRECENKYQRKLQPVISLLHFINGIVFVPIVHDCKPRDYNLVMQYQKYLEEGHVYLARRMSRTVSFEFDQKGNTVNAVAVPSSSSLKKNSNLVAQPSASLKRKVHDNGGNSKTVEPADKKSKTLSNGNALDSASYQNSEYAVQKNETFPIPSNTFPFKIPPKSMLKEVCVKLGIKYCKDAKEFWKEIKFVRIDPFSKNIQSQKFKSKNLYKIFSNLFTGKFSDYGQIYYAINCAFRDKMVSDGQIPVEEINSLISSYTVTKKHLKFIAKFLPCRMMIFNRDNNDEAKKYGNWKNLDQSNILTIVLSFSNRKYSVVSHF